MARLTRTQKFAELREQLSNDREAEVKNEELSKYEDRLKSLQSIFEEPKKEIEKEEVKETVLEDKKEKEEFDELDFLSSFDTGSIDKTIDDLINKKISILEDFEPKNEENVDEPLDINKLDEISKQIENIDKEDEDNLLDSLFPIEEETKEFVNEINVVKEDQTTKEKESDIDLFNLNKLDEISKQNDDVDKKDDVLDSLFPIEEEAKEFVNEINVVKEDQAPIEEETKELVIENKKEESILEESKDNDSLAEISPIVEKIENIIEDSKKDDEEPINKVDVVKEDQTTKEKESDIDLFNLNKLDEISKQNDDVDKKDDVLDSLFPIEEEASFEDIKIVEEAKEPLVVNNEYVEGTLAEVEAYNKNDGCQTVEDISKTLIDNIRHNKEEKEAIEAEDEFSNTVSLEIDKVLNELNVDTSTVNLENVLDNEIAQKEEIKPEEYADKISDTFEHPVLTKKEEEPIEIMPLEETFKQETIDDTIPFVMEDVKNEEEIEYYDDEKPNKILNIFLIILIVILLAILGVIAYYILYAKGIIG